MFYFIATLVLNVGISVLFKLFPRYGINSLQAIVVNYCVCVVTGCLFTGNMPFTSVTVHTSWFPWTILMGIAFISIFNLMAYCTKVSGITSMVLANKLSLVIPVICSLILYHEHASMLKTGGILLAFPAVYLSTRTSGEKGAPTRLLWPAMLFFASGGLDTLVNYIQATYLHTHEAESAATIICFATAGVSGLVLLAIKMAGGKTNFEMRNVVAGICLGIPNFFSIFFLVKALNSKLFESSATIPMLNIGVLLASSVTAIVLFREAAGKLRIAGLILALLAIMLIAWGD